MTTAEAMTFHQFSLRPSTQAAIAAMGISEPTPIQQQVIPVMLEGHDVIGQARTGSGKTLAYALPIVERCDPRIRLVQALVLVPTRELAIQVGGVMQPLARSRGLRSTLLYGGHSLVPEKQALASGAQIVVATPGRTLDHLYQGTLSLRDVRVFVLDEGDEMLDRGFGPDVERIISQTPRDRQTALLSATVPQWVLSTAARHLQSPVMLRADQELQTPPEIAHTVYEVESDTAKFAALRSLLDQQGEDPILVFGRTKHGVKKLATRLETSGYTVVALQGNLSQGARERVIADFRSGAARILVATNVAARGLDFADISQVINYELPDSAELFTHRAGRTGRMGKAGEAITLLTPEDLLPYLQIERALGRKLPRRSWRPGETHQSSALTAQPSDGETPQGTTSAANEPYRLSRTPARHFGFRGRSRFHR